MFSTGLMTVGTRDCIERDFQLPFHQYITFDERGHHTIIVKVRKKFVPGTVPNGNAVEGNWGRHPRSWGCDLVSSDEEGCSHYRKSREGSVSVKVSWMGLGEPCLRAIRRRLERNC